MRNVGQEFSCGIDHRQGRGHMQRRQIGDVRQQSPYACVDQRMTGQVRTAVDDAVTDRRRSGHLAEEIPQFRRRSRPGGLRGVSIRHPFTARSEQGDVKARRASIEDQYVTITALVGAVSTHHTPPVHSRPRHGAPPRSNGPSTGSPPSLRATPATRTWQGADVQGLSGDDLPGRAVDESGGRGGEDVRQGAGLAQASGSGCRGGSRAGPWGTPPRGGWRAPCQPLVQPSIRYLKMTGEAQPAHPMGIARADPGT